ncbi:MAG: coenzyme F420 hydrogenase subunit beta [Parasphingorhabdus sp.]
MQKLVRVDPDRLSIVFSHPELCTRSGTCVGICPEKALSLGEDYYPVINEDLCTECGKCNEVCPGQSVDFSRLGELSFADPKPPESFDGRVEEVHVAYASEEPMRYGGAGGGVVTALLYDLLKHGDVDGCVVTRMRADKPWLGEPFIARNREDLLQSQGSRYTVIPYNLVLQQIRQEGGKYAVAALPCQVHGLRFALQQDAELKKQIPFVIGLFCGGALEPFVVPELLETKGIDKTEIKDFQFRGGEWPGKMRAIMRQGEVRDLHYSNYKDGAYNYFVGLYMPTRCQTCVDGSGLFSDLSVSDAWTRDKQGNYKFPWHSRILIRNENGRKILNNAIQRGTLIATNLGDDPAYLTHRQQTQRKGMNAPLRLARWFRKGISVPNYGLNTPQSTTKERLTERVVSSLLWLGKFRAIRYPLIKFLTSGAAVPLIKLRLFLKNRKYRKAS